ncbi:unnamed protein product, partial [Discosporangium mesarthrocarpum]
GTTGAPGADSPTPSTMMSLSHHCMHLPLSLTEVVYVPTQKITTLHPSPGSTAVAAAAAAIAAGGGEGGGGGSDLVQEDSGDFRLSSKALVLNPGLLGSFTGMHTNLTDARRALSSVEQAQAEGGPPETTANTWG